MQIPATRESVSEAFAEGAERYAKLAAAPAAVWGRSLAPGKWTAGAILAHVAETEAVFLYRFLKTVSEPGVPIVPFDQDAWVAALDSGSVPPEISLGVLAGIRPLFLHHLARLSDAALARTAHHPERGELTALALAGLAAAHSLHHCSQIEKLAEG